MHVGNVVLDTNKMRFDEVDTLISELRKVRERKGQARIAMTRLHNAVSVSADEQFTYCNKYTGEILKAEDWEVYDEKNHYTHTFSAT